jgi:gamma-glutamylcyclotransferase (GGCT)/AIG2-like uncharacterized protein YtfP
MSNLIFVYGTLKSGHVRNSFLRGQKFIGVAYTEPNYKIYRHGSYPALVEDPNGSEIYGELYEVDDNCLIELDKIEGVDVGLFTKKTIKLNGYHLFSLPVEKNVNQMLFSKSALCYFFLNRDRLVGCKDCGQNWTIN